MLLDTNIVIHACQPERAWLSPWTRHPEAACASVTRVEALGFTGISTGEDVAIREFLSQVISYTLDDEVVESAVRLRQQKRMKLGEPRTKQPHPKNNRQPLSTIVNNSKLPSPLVLHQKDVRLRISRRRQCRPQRIPNHNDRRHNPKRRQPMAQWQIAHAGRIILHFPLVAARHISIPVLAQMLRQLHHRLIRHRGHSHRPRRNNEEVPIR